MTNDAKADTLALWAVRVLDAWSKKTERHWACSDEGDDVTGPYWSVFSLSGGYTGLGVGPTPDAARIAAARALSAADPTLPQEPK